MAGLELVHMLRDQESETFHRSSLNEMVQYDDFEAVQQELVPE